MWSSSKENIAQCRDCHEEDARIDQPLRDIIAFIEYILSIEYLLKCTKHTFDGAARNKNTEYEKQSNSFIFFVYHAMVNRLN